MGRRTRVLLVVATLSLVFAPGLLRGDHRPAPKDIAAAVLAPTSNDGATVSAARTGGADTVLEIVAALMVAFSLALVASTWRPVVIPSRQHHRHTRRSSSSRRGPPALSA